MIDIYKKLIELYKQGESAVLCTVVSTKGSTPLKEGAQMIVCNDKTFGSVGGGRTEKATIEKAHEILKAPANTKINIDLISESGTSCGGKVEIYFEPLLKKYKLYIFGAGHVGKALASTVKNLGFDVTVIDDREGIYDDWENDKCNKNVSDFEHFLTYMKFDVHTFIVIITYDHETDWKILSVCAKNEWHYLGMMGSHSKVKAMSKKLLDDGISQAQIDRINMPVGLDINAEGANEIAISIAAKLIEEKNKLSK